MKPFFFVSAFFLFTQLVQAQPVPRRVVVEHFTNSRCSICALRNPGFYNLIDNYYDDGLIHIAYHPSAPYVDCIFHQHNPTENDARTQFYGVYGSTPRVVVQGRVIAPANPILQPTAIDSIINSSSAVDVRVSLQMQGVDSVRITTRVYTVAPTVQINATLFAAITEDTIFYNAPNGEQRHYDVFRKGIFPGNGLSVVLPTLGDSLTFEQTVAIEPAWVLSRLNAVAFLQRPNDKLILNADKATEFTVAPNGIAHVPAPAMWQVYPNPSEDGLFYFKNAPVEAHLMLINGLGQVMENIPRWRGEPIHVEQAGLYTVILMVDGKPSYHKILAIGLGK